jgi:dipeptidyl aminopeptidase/acylaminoacyl peptidase
MYSMIVPARDGQKLICYYTLPKEVDKGGYVEKPIPLVVVPHGGPFKVRDKFQFNRYHQWLASCGYAVLSVNFRLSSGFGKAFVNAGNGEWGGKAHFDVIDALEVCIDKGITERGRLAVFGGSYGGYESLASLTFTPEYFTCCVAICGPSNLKTVLDNVPKFWESTSKPLSDRTMFFTKQAFITSMGGNPNDPKGVQYLQKCSPLNYLEGIQAPLLLVHGKNDHIVAEKESEQIYNSMKANHKKVTYIVFPDEGHRFAKFANEMMYLDHAERFLSNHLGGSYRPVNSHILADSSAQVSD